MTNTQTLLRIKGGFSNVPDNLKCKTHLREMGLKPKSDAEPKAEVHNHYMWVKLYDLADCVDIKKATPKQLAALEKAREKAIQNRTCKNCGTIAYLKKHLIDDLCSDCLKEIRQLEYLKEQQTSTIETFKTYLNSDYYLLDSETTGLDSDAEIIELAIISISGETIYNQRFKPVNNIPEEVSEIHGITDKDVQNCPTFKDEYETIRSILENKTVLIYNASYDTRLLEQTCMKWNLNDIAFTSICIMEKMMKFYDSRRYISLANASGEETLHGALEDCLQVLQMIHDVIEGKLTNS